MAYCERHNEHYSHAEGGCSECGAEAASAAAVTISRGEYESLLKDKDRLDFLEKAHEALNASSGTNYGWKIIINHNVVRFMAGHCYPRDGYPGIDLHDSQAGIAKLPTCREAIDDVMPNKG